MTNSNDSLIGKTALALLNRIRFKYGQPPIYAQSGFSVSDWEYGLQLAETSIKVMGDARSSDQAIVAPAQLTKNAETVSNENLSNDMLIEKIRAKKFNIAPDAVYIDYRDEIAFNNGIEHAIIVIEAMGEESTRKDETATVVLDDGLVPSPATPFFGITHMGEPQKADTSTAVSAESIGDKAAPTASPATPLIDRLEDFKRSCVQAGAIAESVAIGDCIKILERYWQAYVPPNSCEIPDDGNGPEGLKAKIASLIIKNQYQVSKKYSDGILVHGQLDAAHEIVELIRPYLRTTEESKGTNGGPFCTHEAFEGRCIHCNSHFINGKPVSMNHWESRDLAILMIDPLKKALSDRAKWSSPGDLECAVLAVIYLITPYLTTREPGADGEISDVKPGTLPIDVDATLKALCTQYQFCSDAIIPRASKDAPDLRQIGLIRDAHLNLYRILSEYKKLATREPVSVSLEKCAKAVSDMPPSDELTEPDYHEPEEYAKAVLESLKAQGLEIEYVD